MQCTEWKTGGTRRIRQADRRSREVFSAAEMYGVSVCLDMFLAQAKKTQAQSTQHSKKVTGTAGNIEYA